MPYIADVLVDNMQGRKSLYLQLTEKPKNFNIFCINEVLGAQMVKYVKFSECISRTRVHLEGWLLLVLWQAAEIDETRS